MANDRPVQLATITFPNADGAGKRSAFALAVDHADRYPEIVERHKDPLHATGRHMDEDEVIDVLNDLLECCRDGVHGYRACAEHAKTPDLKNLLFNHARLCATGAGDLTECIRQLGGKPEQGGSVGGALQRGWLVLRGVLAGQSDHAMLRACEHGEEAALGRYRRALRQPLPGPVRATLTAQYDDVQHRHDTISSLQAGYRAIRMGY